MIHNTDDMPRCIYCGKLIPQMWFLNVNSTTGNAERLPYHNGYVQPPDAFCAGHATVLCPQCGILIVEGYHDEDECARYRSVTTGTWSSLASLEASPPQYGAVPQPRTPVPDAFYRAFSDSDSDRQGEQSS